MQFNIFLITLLFLVTSFGQSGTYIKGPALVEGFTTITSAAGTTTLTVTSQTKQIVTGSTTQTIVLPDATTLPLGRKFFIINKSSGTVTVNANGGGLLGTVTGGNQVEIHLRAAGSAAGTWDFLSYSSGGGAWGSITGTLSAQTDLQSALDLKAPLASPTFSGTITTPLTANRAVVTGASGVLSASATTDTQIGYLSTLSSNAQTQLDAKQARSTLTTKGDLYVATASATVARQGVGSDGQVLMSDSTQTNGVKWTTPTSENLIFDGNAESGITNFVEGSYSAATRPAGTFTASSGSGSFAISTSSSSPLFGSNSFLLTKSSGASRQGRAIERTIAIDSGYRTKMLKTRIDYTIVSGSFVAGTNGSSPTDSSLIWYVGQYNGSAWTYTEPSTFKMFSNSTTNSDWVEGEFQVNSDTTQLKLIGFISESANSAWVVKAEVGFRLSAYLAGTPISDWVSYTPTVSNLGTGSSTSNVAKWRRVGDSAEYMITFQKDASGGSGASVVTWSLVSGQSVDANKLPFGSATAKADNIGSAWVVSGGNYSASNYVPLVNSATTFAISKPTASGQLTGADIPASTYIIFKATVPITGWASSTQQSDGYDSRIVGLFQRKSSGSHTSTGNFQDVASWDTNASVDIDDVVGFNKTTGEYTFKRSGRYKVTAAVAFSVVATGSRASQILYDGVIIGRSADLPGSSTSFIQAKCEGLVNAQAGKIVKIQGRQDSGGNLAYAADATQTYVIIEEIKSPQTISATEAVALNVYGAAPNSALTGSTTDVTWNNSSVDDTHGTFVKSTGIYTVPMSGWYNISATFRSGGTFAAGNLTQLYINIQGTNKYGHIVQAASSSVTELSPVVSVQSIKLNSGDTVKLQATSSATSPTYLSTTQLSNFSISRVK